MELRSGIDRLTGRLRSVLGKFEIWHDEGASTLRGATIGTFTDED
jgi:hypothetical protein